MIHYILQIIAFQLLFLLAYDLFLKRETFFNLNRVYLLITPILSFVLPLIEIDIIRDQVPNEYLVSLPTVLIDTSAAHVSLPEVFLGTNTSESAYITMSTILLFFWCSGMLICSSLFYYKIRTILRLKKTGIQTAIENLNLISLPQTNTAFSFFNTIFLGESLSENKKTHILLHEKVHVNEYHSYDLLFFEVLRVVFWFNPLVYVYQKRMTLLQEYIADSKAILETDKKTYYQGLLSQVFQTDKISFINTFFNHSLIKSRIVMLQKSKSKKIVQLRYLLLIPVVCSMLVYTSCSQDSIAQSGSESSQPIASSSSILKNIDILKESIAAKGEMTDEERKALKTLLLLTTENGFSEPFFNDVHDQAEIPFGVIEKVPVFPGCETQSQEEAKNCFSSNIRKLVAENFNTKLGEDLKLSGVQKIYAKFKIDNTGKVTNIKVRGPKVELEEEAIRVLKMLPKMTPGVQDGVNVGVMYTLPIAFEIKE